MAGLEITVFDLIAMDAIHDGLTNSTGLLGKTAVSKQAFTANINALAGICRMTTPLNNLASGTAAGSAASTTFPNGYFARGKILTENIFVHRLFQHTKIDLRTQTRYDTATPLGGNNSFKTIRPLVTSAIGGVGGISRALTRQPIQMAYFPTANQAEYDFAFTHMFQHVPIPHGFKDIYLICDSTIHFLDQLTTTTAHPANTRFHIMFGSPTYSDPANPFNETTVDVTRAMPAGHGGKYSHRINVAINMSRCDNLSLIDGTVNHAWGAGDVVNETIIIGQGAGAWVRQYNDARDATAQPAIKASVEAAPNKLEQLCRMQAKRLGDHNQIRFALWLKYNYVGAPVRIRNHTNGAGVPVVGVIPNRSPIQSANIYFVTQDWPAFCCAIMNRVSSIILTLPSSATPYRGYLIAVFQN